jgi:Matrixin
MTVGMALGLAVAGSAFLFGSAASQAYTLLGGSLGLDQRDLRVYPNFSDPGANDNLQADPDFPQILGASLAIAKAAAEWSSRPLGSGLSDPLQVDPLGSGDANFDFHWQGLASSPGGTDDNVLSEISGSSAGVFAFTELPIQDGWRIRFYADAANWHDGPGAPPAGSTNKDLQGVATHELGHALGLGHSSDAQATMLGALLGNGIQNRSIESDDRAGLQALYGARDVHKPVLLSYAVVDTQHIVLHGQHFDPSTNEVWFTRAAGLNDGQPSQVLGLASSHGGTQVWVPLPADAAAGQILLRVPGSGGAALSNALPYAPGFSTCPPIQNYGSPTQNSLGNQVLLSSQGRASLSINDLRIQANGLVPDTLCILVSGTQSALGGPLWVGGQVRRYAVQNADFLGSCEFAIPIQAGMVETRRYFQLWYQDQNHPTGAAWSDALQIYFCP